MATTTVSGPASEVGRGFSNDSPHTFVSHFSALWEISKLTSSNRCNGTFSCQENKSATNNVSVALSFEVGV